MPSMNGYRSSHQNYLYREKAKLKLNTEKRILQFLIEWSGHLMQLSLEHQIINSYGVSISYQTDLLSRPLEMIFFSFQNTEIVCMLRHFNKLGTCMMSICGLWILDKWRLFLFRVKHILSVRKKKEYRCKLHQ